MNLYGRDFQTIIGMNWYLDPEGRLNTLISEWDDLNVYNCHA
jgi:hypothetical protein